jgi:transposase
MSATTHPQLGSVNEAPLYVALDLSKRTWTVAMTSGLGVVPWVRSMPAAAWAELARLVAEARGRFGLSGQGAVISCYEAGRDGFWIHRALVQQGVANRVVDSASIEVNRRARQTKTDRIDARKLVGLLVRVCLGDRGAWREVHVPTIAAEAARHEARDRIALQKEQTALINQLRGWLTTWGTTLPTRRRAAWWTQVRDWTGAPLPDSVQARLARASARLTLVREQLRELTRAAQRAVEAAPATSAAGRLVRLRAVGVRGTTTLLGEGLEWRAFTNRRQVGGMLGFAPTHASSGEVHRDGGISHAGNRRWQGTMIQLAWSWVRLQPKSALTQWYVARFGVGKRARRIGIVALARKLLIALWRYATTGLVPTGAQLKAA